MTLKAESIAVGQPVALFRLPSNQSDVAVTPGGDRFVVTEVPHAAGQTIHVLTNWHERVK